MSPPILALDVAGAPHRWINVRAAAHPKCQPKDDDTPWGHRFGAHECYNAPRPCAPRGVLHLSIRPMMDNAAGDGQPRHLK